MKKNVLKLISLFLLVFLFLTGCQKSINDKPVNSETQTKSDKNDGDEKRGCHLIFSGVHDPTNFDEDYYHYNSDGLCDASPRTDGIFGDQKYVMQYDASGKLKKTTYFIGSSLSNTIRFVYEKGRIKKDIWYYGNTMDVMDEVWYTYDAKGRIVRNESFLNDYYANTKYSEEGNVLSVTLFFGGSPYWASIMTYSKPVKNPFLAVPGMDHYFEYYTPTSFASLWRNNSEKEIGYDVDGTPIVLFDYDAKKTIWNINHQNYPLSNTCFDNLTKQWFKYSFDYENCGGERDNANSNSQITAPPTQSVAGKINPMMIMMRNPSKSMKQQVDEFRQQMKNISNLRLNN